MVSQHSVLFSLQTLSIIRIRSREQAEESVFEISERLRGTRCNVKPLEEYHHFKTELIDPRDRVARCERYITDLLLASQIPDSQRDSSICWELKHQATTLQFAKILAAKRRLSVDICAIGLMLHDIYSVVHGKYENHARLGAPIAIEILRKINGFSEEELDQIWRIVYNHSDKQISTQDPYQEIGKDVDVLDCFLYEGAFDYYLGNKPLPVFREYLRRAKNVWRELGLPIDPRFDLLDGYGPSWFQLLQTLQREQMRSILAILWELMSFGGGRRTCPPPFCIVTEDDTSILYGNRRRWRSYVKSLTNLSTSLASSERLKPFLQVLAAILKTNVDYKIIDEYSQVGRNIVSDETLAQTADILLEGRKSPGLENRALLFWPLIGIYESHTGKQMNRRLEELGVQLSTETGEKQQ
jgi:hypothetical protein